MTAEVMSKASDRLEFPTVDVLRGFAAISVVVYHVIEHFKWQAFPIHGLLVWFRLGWMGVDLFLVISGFVISLSVANLIEHRSYAAFAGEFAIRRARRIMPLYYVTCVLFVALIAPQNLWQWSLLPNVLVHLVFVHNIVLPFHGAIDGANWSVGLEVQFYLLCVLLGPWLCRGKWWHVALFLLVVSWAWRFAVVLAVPIQGPMGPMHRFQISTQLPGTLDEFGAGILLGRLLRGPYGQKLLAAGRSWPIVPILFAAGAIVLVLTIFWQHAVYWNNPAMIVFWRSGCAAGFVTVVFACCCLDAAWFRTVSAPLRYLGTISYGIYLWHLLVIISLLRIDWITPERGLWTTLLVTILLASGSWHLLEQPFIQRRSKAVLAIPDARLLRPSSPRA